ncbi:MAG: type II and III secretion system protein [Rhodothermales bacterium]
MRTPANLLSFALILLALLIPGRAAAQDAAERMIRTYVPEDQLVSFLPSTPFNTFVEFVNPIFRRVTGKEVIDVEMRNQPIGISISTMHFLDALELVLKYNNLQYRETERYFMIQEVPVQPQIRDSGAVASAAGAVPTSVSLANLDSRQIEINAVLFEVNHTKARESGMDWSLIFGSTGGTSGGASAGAGGGGGASASGDASAGGVNFSLKTEKLFSSFEDIITSPSEIKFSDLNRLFRLAEAQGFGETVASPSVTVQSGVAGDIQIGSDVPVQTRDFSGNTVTELFKTGIIVNVTPTLITEALADTLGSPTVDFLHLAIQVEKSGSRPSAAGPVIDRSSANTQVVLLDGEQTVIGGLFSTDETISRSGIPLLKDLPGWFFGLRYVFGKSQRQVTQKELVIAIEARIVDPVRSRYARSRPDNMLEQQRAAVRRALEQFNAELNTDVQKGKMN